MCTPTRSAPGMLTIVDASGLYILYARYDGAATNVVGIALHVNGLRVGELYCPAPLALAVPAVLAADDCVHATALLPGNRWGACKGLFVDCVPAFALPG